MPLEKVSRSPRDSRSSSSIPSRTSRSMSSSRSRSPSSSVSRSFESKVLPSTEATERRSRSSCGSRSIRFSTACWMVAGRASAEISASFEKLQAPVSSFAIPPDSTSERTSSFVKNGLPSVASRSRRASSSETFGAPTSDSTSARCSEGEKGGERDRHEAGVVREGLEHADEGVPLVGLRLAVAADDERRRRTADAGRCTAAPRSRPPRRAGSRGSARAACRRRSASASGR